MTVADIEMKFGKAERVEKLDVVGLEHGPAGGSDAAKEVEFLRRELEAAEVLQVFAQLCEVDAFGEADVGVPVAEFQFYRHGGMTVEDHLAHRVLVEIHI